MRLTRPGSLAAARRKISTTPHYQTFPTSPPKTKGRPPSQSPSTSNEYPSCSRPDSKNSGGHHASPLPFRQLAVLAFVALCEQTALNSISPYLPKMASTFPEVHGKDVGVFVGSIASAFAAAQFATNFFWGWLSDRIGRKPVILTGTLLTAASLLAFGFCRTLWQAIITQVLMGLVNGNQGIVSTCLGEITDRSNQSRAFAYLPVIYGIGAITGPLLGGLAAGSIFPNYPYLAPNLFSALILLADLVVAMFFLEESLEEARLLPPLGQRLCNLFASMYGYLNVGQRTYRCRRKTYDARGDTAQNDGAASNADSSSDISRPLSQSLLPDASPPLRAKDFFDGGTVVLLSTYLIFQLSNISYNSLYPIFASAGPPTGRSLTPQEIGLSLSFAGLVAIVFQIGFFNVLLEKVGNRVTYRLGLFGFVIAFFATPFVGYKSAGVGKDVLSRGKIWLWLELGLVLLVKTVAAVGGLTSALLLVSVDDDGSFHLFLSVSR